MHVRISPGPTARSVPPLPTALLVLLVALVAPDRVAAASVAQLAYRLPVDGEVVSGFVAPGSAYGSGHRGVDLRAAAAPVRAAAAGRVSFAGAVAGARWVSLQHPDGIRTSYGELGTVAVKAGERVVAGALLGTVAGVHGEAGLLHFSARRGEAYLDPLDLVGGWVATLVGPGGWSAGDLPDIPRYALWDGQHRFGIVPRSPKATGPGYVLPPNPNHVISIAGLGSRTGEPALDVTHLGYRQEDVTEFSYAGRRGDASGPAPFGPQDTWRGVHEAARHLEEELRARWASSPGQAVDLVGHSMGGVVALYYLLARHDPLDPGLPPIAHVATIASPLEGADLAAGIVAVSDDFLKATTLALIGALVDEHDPMSQAVADLAPGSDVVTTVTGRWEQAHEDLAASPLATGTRVLTLGGEADLIVPEHRSDLPDAAHAVLPGTHDGVRETEAARIVLHEFLADAPVPGEDGGLGHVVSHPISWIERRLPGWLLPG